MWVWFSVKLHHHKHRPTALGWPFCFPRSPALRGPPGHSARARGGPDGALFARVSPSSALSSLKKLANRAVLAQAHSLLSQRVIRVSRRPLRHHLRSPVLRETRGPRASAHIRWAGRQWAGNEAPGSQPLALVQGAERRHGQCTDRRCRHLPGKGGPPRSHRLQRRIPPGAVLVRG